MSESDRRRQFKQWTFIKTIDDGTLINLNLAAAKHKMQCMTHTTQKSDNKKKKDRILGFLILTARVTLPGLDKIIGEAECRRSTGYDHLIEIQMQHQHWETGSLEKGALIKFRSQISELKKNIHQGHPVKKLKASLRKTYLKYPLIVQSHVDDAQVSKTENEGVIHVRGPKIVTTITGKTTCATMQPRPPRCNTTQQSDDESQQSDDEPPVNPTSMPGPDYSDHTKHYDTYVSLPSFVYKKSKEGICYQPTDHELCVTKRIKDKDVSGNIREEFKSWLGKQTS